MIADDVAIEAFARFLHPLASIFFKYSQQLQPRSLRPFWTFIFLPYYLSMTHAGAQWR